MARLTEEEKIELLRATKSAAPLGMGEGAHAAPPRRLLTPMEYAEFATFAARFNRGEKPVRFVGDNWKL